MDYGTQAINEMPLKDRIEEAADQFFYFYKDNGQVSSAFAVHTMRFYCLEVEQANAALAQAERKLNQEGE